MAEELPWLILSLFPHVTLPTHIKEAANIETLFYAFIIYIPTHPVQVHSSAGVWIPEAGQTRC